MRCPYCDLEVTTEVTTPEHGEPGFIKLLGRVTVPVHVVQICFCCKAALRETDLSLTGRFSGEDIVSHLGEPHQLSVQIDDVEAMQDGSHCVVVAKAELKCSCRPLNAMPLKTIKLMNMEHEDSMTDLTGLA